MTTGEKFLLVELRRKDEHILMLLEDLDRYRAELQQARDAGEEMETLLTPTQRKKLGLS